MNDTGIVKSTWKTVCKLGYTSFVSKKQSCKETLTSLTSLYRRENLSFHLSTSTPRLSEFNKRPIRSFNFIYVIVSQTGCACAEPTLGKGERGPWPRTSEPLCYMVVLKSSSFHLHCKISSFSCQLMLIL